MDYDSTVLPTELFRPCVVILTTSPTICSTYGTPRFHKSNSVWVRVEHMESRESREFFSSRSKVGPDKECLVPFWTLFRMGFIFFMILGQSQVSLTP
jgi:hypothetical protein